MKGKYDRPRPLIQALVEDHDTSTIRQHRSPHGNQVPTLSQISPSHLSQTDWESDFVFSGAAGATSQTLVGAEGGVVSHRVVGWNIFLEKSIDLKMILIDIPCFDRTSVACFIFEHKVDPTIEWLLISRGECSSSDKVNVREFAEFCPLCRAQKVKFPLFQHVRR